MSVLRNAVRLLRERRQAERDFRKLCKQGRGPWLQVSIRIDDEDPEWTGLHGITGVSAPVSLTPEGVRSILKVVRTIRATCVRELILINREEPE